MERNKRDYKPYTVKWIDDEGKVENWLVDGTNWDMMMEMADDKANGRSICLLYPTPSPRDQA